MMIKIINFTILICLTLVPTLSADYLRNVPQTLVQPNGDIIYCLASGDEFYHWLHDENDFTIVKNPLTGYWVYATKENNRIVHTSYIVGMVDPATVFLKQGLRITKEEYLRRRDTFYAKGKPVLIPHTGTINNLCVFIRFSDEIEFTDQRSMYNDMFNLSTAGANSMLNYFYEASYQNLTISTTSYPTCNPDTNISYQDTHPRSYYQPYDAITNPNGYQNDDERAEREHTLLRDAIDHVESQIPTNLNIDGDGDGNVDIVTFIIQGAPDGWGDLLWAHHWFLYTHDVYINGKQVYDYIFTLQIGFNVGTLCHETFHNLGAQDLYHYSFDGLNPVYFWDLMGSHGDTPPHMGAYMKYRYGEWINGFVEINSMGTYTLGPLGGMTLPAYKIQLPSSSTEYFIVEYRRKMGTFENSLPGSGLLVYRINTDSVGKGNASGPPDEVYIYRPNGTLTERGDPDKAHFTADQDRVSINRTTNPNPFYSNGNSSYLFIADIGHADNTISFFVSPSYSVLSGDVYNTHNGPLITGYCYWIRGGDVVTPSGYALNVENGVICYADSGLSVIAEGAIDFGSGSAWTNFFSLNGYRKGIKSKGRIRMFNGGTIKFH